MDYMKTRIIFACILITILSACSDNGETKVREISLFDVPSLLPGEEVKIIKDNYHTTTDIIIPPGVIINGNDATVHGNPLILSDGVDLKNMHFTGGDHAIFMGKDRVRKSTIQYCSFSNYTRACIFAPKADDCIIQYNSCEQSQYPPNGSGILFLGGRRNIIRGNKITGGITGILFLTDTANNGGSEGIPSDNVISGNSVSNFSEEGISFDIHGNSTDGCGARESDSILSVEADGINLTHIAWNNAGNDYTGYDIVFISGNSSGKERTILKRKGNFFSIDMNGLKPSPGDAVVIGSCPKRNIIRENTVDGPDSLNSILLYGLCSKNLIENNTIVHGHVRILSIDGLIVTADSVTGTPGRAPSNYNSIRNNIVSEGDIVLEYYNFRSGTPYRSVGNNIIKNRINGKIMANEQHCYISPDQKYNLSDLINVTLSGTELSQ